MIAEIEHPYRNVVLLYRSLRDELLAALADADLAFTPGGDNPTLGDLCVALGATQRCYAESFRTFEAKFDERAEESGTMQSVADIRTWYETLDAELEAALEDLTAEQAQQAVVRGEGHQMPLLTHLFVFNEALLIFCGKASVYLKALGKEAPGKWGDWSE